MADDPPNTASSHSAIASWLFGSILLLFYMGVFAFAPAELPEFKHKMLAVFSALLCALFTFFFVGSLHVTVQLKNRWSKIAIQSGGGAAAFVLILWWWNNPELAPVKSIPAQQAITVNGSNNTIMQAGGNINNQYGVPQKVVDRLLKELDDKDIKLQERDSVIASWIQKYKELDSQLAGRSDETAQQAQAFLADGKLEEAEQLFKQALANDVKNAAANAFSLAQIKVLQLNYPEAKTYYQQAVQLAPDNALYLNNLGFHLYTLGDYAAAEPLYRRSLAIREKALGKDHPKVAISLNNLAELYHAQGRYEQAAPLYTRSLAIDEKVLGKDHPDVALSLNNLAALYYTQGRYEQAAPLYTRSLAIREKALGKDHPDVAQSLNNLAALYQAQGRYEQAVPLYTRSLAIWEKALDKDHPDVASGLNNLAELYRTQGRYELAEPLYTRSLALWEKALGKDHPYVAASLNNLAALYDSQGRYELAEPLYTRSLAIREKALGKDHPYVAASLNNLAELYRTQGRYELAEPLYTRSLTIWEKALGKDHPDVAISLNNLAGLYKTQGRYEQAAPLYTRSLAILEKVLGKDHPDVATGLNNLAVFYEKQGRYELAEPLYSRSLAILEKALGKDHPDTQTVRGHLQALQARLHGQFQVQVKAVSPDSPAEQLGLRPGDIFTHYHHKPVLGMVGFDYERSLEPAAGPAQALNVLRAGKELVFNVKPGKIGVELQELAPKVP